MKAKLIHLFFSLLLALSAGATELPPLIDALEAEDYNARYKARMDMQAMLADASKPDADPAHRAALEEDLVNGLQSGTNRISRLWLIRMLEWFGTENSVGALENLLADEDGHLQDAARRALAVLPGDTAGKALQAALGKAPTEQKPAYIDALVYRGDARAAGKIARYLKSENPQLVCSAAVALGKLGYKKALDDLNAARKRSPAELKPVIASAMLDLGVPPSIARELLRTEEKKPDIFVGASGEEHITLNAASTGSAVTGNKLRIRLGGKNRILSLAEVQVFAAGNNVAQNGTATQSSTWSAAAANRAIDGNTSGAFSDGSVTHTDNSTDPWWEVDLGESVVIDEIVVWNRNDCCPERLDNYTLEVYDSQGQVVVTKTPAKRLYNSDRNISIRIGAFQQLAEQNSKEALQVLKDLIADEGMMGRAAILRAAMEAPDARLVNFVVGTLPQAGPADQQIILAAIADRKLADYEKDILSFLPASTGAGRDAAIKTLGVVGSEASFDPLYALFLQQSDEALTQALARLKVPAVDTRLFATLDNESDEQKKIAALRLLVVRMPDGTVDRLNELAGSGHSEAIRKAVFKELEKAGNVDSCRLLASTIVQQDSMKRPAQQTLKKLSSNLKMPDALWDAVYQPALQSAPDDAAREDLLAILDGAAGSKSLAYLETLVMDSAHPLRAAGTRSLARWPTMEAAEVWIKLMGREGAAEEDLAAAQKGLIRIITQVPGDDRKKYDLAVKAIQKAPTPDIKEALVSRCQRPNNRKKNLFDNAFKVLLDDPDIGLKVYALLGKTPPPELLFTPLFDGQTLQGWTPRGGKAAYAVREGVIVGTSVLKTPNTFLCTDKRYGDFELEFEVKCGPINSGVQIRSQENDKGHVHGPQVEIEHSPGQAGYIYGEKMGTGWLSPEPNSKDTAVKQHTRFKNDEWNHYRILAEGPRIQTFINGEPVADITHPETYTAHPEGFIGLQVHSHNVADVEIEWRNIRIREIQ